MRNQSRSRCAICRPARLKFVRYSRSDENDKKAASIVASFPSLRRLIIQTEVRRGLREALSSAREPFREGYLSIRGVYSIMPEQSAVAGE